MMRVACVRLLCEGVPEEEERGGEEAEEGFVAGAWCLCAVVRELMVVMVLMVAMAFWAAPLRVMLEGRREQVAYWPGVMGVQLRTTVPAVVVLRGELEVVGGGALAGYGCGGGGAAVDGEEEAAVGDSGAGERDEGGGVVRRSW